MTEEEYAVIGKRVTYEEDRSAIEADLSDLTSKIISVLTSAIGVYQPNDSLVALMARYTQLRATLAEVKASIDALTPTVVEPVAEEPTTPDGETGPDNGGA